MSEYGGEDLGLEPTPPSSEPPFKASQTPTPPSASFPSSSSRSCGGMLGSQPMECAGSENLFDPQENELNRKKDFNLKVSQIKMEFLNSEG